MRMCIRLLVRRFRAVAVSVAAVLLLAGVVSAAAEAVQFDRHGRRVVPGAAPLVFGPLPALPWRGRVDFGTVLPLGVDAVAIGRGLGPAFRMVLPRVGPPGSVFDAVVEDVEREDVSALAAGVAGLNPGNSVVYTGTLRRRPDVVVVLSVVNRVLYCRFAVGDEAWVIYSDAMGRPMVRVERRGDAEAVGGGPRGWPVVPGQPE